MEHGIQYSVRDEFVMAASPVTRLLGHSLAVALGFCGLAAISMIPIGAMKVLIWLGIGHLAEPLHALETLLLVVDICLFGIVFLSGVAVFLVETLTATRRQVIMAWRNHE